MKLFHFVGYLIFASQGISVETRDCVGSEDGKEYIGTWNRTTTGKTCQAWSSQSPHDHRFTGLPNNYCRNPDGTRNSVGVLQNWCYTTDPNIRWEFCDIPRCDCLGSEDGKKYSGTWSRTKTGKTCQAWSSQSPHDHRFTGLPNNYCRNPDGTRNSVGVLQNWCYTTDPNTRWEFCDIPRCDCLGSEDGKEYSGTWNRTKTGKTCQVWSSQSPHDHRFTGLPNNYCRNPDETRNSVGVLQNWCYTTDPNTRWEFCDIPRCDCLGSEYGKEYSGTWNRTKTGKTCQAWSSQIPHEQRFTGLPNNYCRNPDGTRNSVGLLQTWCYTTDPNTRWEFCDIPRCDCPRSEYSKEYSGTWNRTKTGKTCQVWSSQSPHEHRFTGLPNNYCRNPDETRNSVGVLQNWCYTTDPNTRWEFCDIPRCDCLESEDGKEYSGTRNRTTTGKTCQAWSSQIPHDHRFTGLPNNYCRNPDKTRNAHGVLQNWCYTTDPNTRWEFCDIPRCDCLGSEDGKEYSGTWNRTKTGKTCQVWSSQRPHENRFTGLPNNYCRNPDGTRNSLGVLQNWCYTSDPNTRWEFCDIPRCDCLGSEYGKEYSGTWNRTKTGKTCQAWSSQIPHEHRFTGLPNNYCRNPDGTRNSLGVLQNWCYTTDPNTRWEFCDIPRCETD